ncbi:MAG TPA: D-2-hydroxyacid dehydrogenase [Candidatus Bathyarchaeia archaeon]|nr:D-2-hydroxyacid dehydrogenase [Candidatus Bathyarchaeia archaeon]
MRIVVLDGATVNPGDNPWDPLARLGELTVHDRTSPGQIVERARGAEVLLTNKTPLARQTFAELGGLRFVSVLATGYDQVDVVAARDRGVLVANVPEYGTDSVAQHVFALLLELCHQVGLHHASVLAGEWSAAPDFCYWKRPLVELAGLTMGIVGYGRTGRRVGEIARAFGMQLIAARRESSGAPEKGEGKDDPPVRRGTMTELFSQADVVSLHCPLGPDTLRFVNRDLLGRMKPSALLINTARGALVDEQALAEALRSKRIAGAGVDVVSHEPIDPANPLLTAPGCIITPHMAWGSLAARRRLLATTAANIEAFVAGRPINLVT